MNDKELKCTSENISLCLDHCSTNVQFLVADRNGLTKEKVDFLKIHERTISNVSMIDVQWKYHHSIAQYASMFNVSYLFNTSLARKVSCLGYRDGCHLCASICKSAFYAGVQCRRIVCLEPSWRYTETSEYHSSNNELVFKPNTLEYRYYLSKHDAKYVVVLTGHYKEHNYIPYKIGTEFFIYRNWRNTNVYEFLSTLVLKPLVALRLQNKRSVHITSWSLRTASKPISNVGIWHDDKTVVYETTRNPYLVVLVTKHGDAHGYYHKSLRFGDYRLYFSFAAHEPESTTYYVYNYPKGELVGLRYYTTNDPNVIYSTQYSCRRSNCYTYNCYRYTCQRRGRKSLQDYRRSFASEMRVPGKYCLPSLSDDSLISMEETETELIPSVHNFSSLLGDLQPMYNIQSVFLDNAFVANNWRRCRAVDLPHVTVSHPSYKRLSFKMKFQNGTRHCLVLLMQLLRYKYCFSVVN